MIILYAKSDVSGIPKISYHLMCIYRGCNYFVTLGKTTGSGELTY